jgi:micrococcal nuclease
MRKRKTSPLTAGGLALLALLAALVTCGRCGGGWGIPAAVTSTPAAIPTTVIASPTATPLASPAGIADAPTSPADAGSPQGGPSGTVTASGLRIRRGPGADFAPIAQLQQGDAVTLLDERGTWLQVQTASGLTGWVAAEFVAFASARSPAAAAAATTVVTPSPPPPAAQEGRVVAITDGDTIRVLLRGQEYAVRYIGIDTPEMGQPNAAAARDKNVALVSGKTVRLEKDVSETDRYGRLLRYVWVGDVMVNAELVRLGYAQAATFPPDVKYQQKFMALQKEAQAAGRGLWQRAATAAGAANLRGGPGMNYPVVGGVKAGDALSLVARNARGDWYQLASGAWIAASLVANAPAGLPVAAVIPTPPPTRPPAVRAAPAVPVKQCDPCYPDVCIPPVSYDLDCPEVPFCQFRVTCDPHGFDGDHDGIGCEKCR